MADPGPWLWVQESGALSLDATTMGLSAADCDALPWESAFRSMSRLEAGAIANPDEQRQVGHYWLRDPELAPTPEQREAIRAMVHHVRAFAETHRARFTDVIHVGIGGSALGPQLLLDALGPAGGPVVHFIDNTDPDGIARVLDGLGDRLRTSLVVVVSKSGSTVETANGAALVFERMRALEIDVGSRAVAITGDGSTLDRRATSEGWVTTFPLWDWVGGRTSVTGAVGLLPAALAGVDVDSFLAGARAMDRWTRVPEWRDNPAAILAGTWALAGDCRGERSMVVLPYCDRLVLFSRFLQQLIMESVGKRHDLAGREVNQGLTVYGNKGSTDQHAFVQQLRDGRNDFFVTFVQVLEDGAGSDSELADGATAGDFLQGFLLGTRQALAEDGRPSLVVTVPRVDAAAMGALVALYERAVGLYASLIGINAYHQPGVEAGKRAARGVVERLLAIRAGLSDDPRCADEIASALSADPVQVFHLLERLVATGRARRSGIGWSAEYRAP